MSNDRQARCAVCLGARPCGCAESGGALALPVREALLAWYLEHARSLPWRGELDPYRIWVSEVMLQQTRVGAVLERYERFLERFPSLAALARAPESAVLEAWAGLGYYRRAQKLQQAARVCVQRHGGQVPADPRAFAALPGVGSYTVGAVQSIAFDAPLPAVDGNVIRVLSRLLCLEQPPAKAAVRRVIERVARCSVEAVAREQQRPTGDWNQALMELGAQRCTPRAPRCEACPLAPWCRARARGCAEALPRRTARAERPEVALAVACAVRDARVLVVRRPPGGLLAGTWGLPAAAGPPEVLESAFGLRPGRELVRWRHVFTHRVWNARAVLCTVVGTPPRGAWWPLAELRTERFPSAFRPAVQALWDTLAVP